MTKYLILFLFLFPTFSFSETAFQTAAKNETTTLHRTALSLYSGSVYVGECITYINGTEIQSFDKKSLTKLMMDLLTPEKFLEFKDRFLNKSLISANEIKDFGFSFLLDFVNFKLELSSPENFLKPNRISLNDTTFTKVESNVLPANYSGFINYSFTKNFTSFEGGNNTQSLSGLIEPNINILGYNLSSTHFLDPSKEKWYRTGTLFTKDLTDSLIRLSAGDLNYTPKTFQNSQKILGFRISKEYNINPTDFVTIKGEREIYLETPSTVEIFINGFLVQTLTLEAGKHLLEDIPVSQGINHIVIRISDNKGKKKIISFQHSGSESMLKKGFHDFDYNVGSTSETVDGKLNYKKIATASFYHRYGINNSWTSGINGQFKKRNINIGPENQFGTSRGLFVHNLTFSKAENDFKGAANRISYFWTCPCGPDNQIKRLSLAYEYQSPHYSTNIFSNTFSIPLQRNNYYLTYSQKITDSTSGQFTFTGSGKTLGNLQQQIYNLGLNNNLGNDLFLTASVQRSINSIDSSKVDSILLQLSYNFDDGKKSLISSFNHSTQNQNSQIEYSHTSNKAVNNLILHARAADSDGLKSGLLSAYYNTQNLELFSVADIQKASKNFSFNPSGSIAFAENSFGFGNHIDQSFLLVQNLQKYPLIVNGDEENYESFIKPNHTAVIKSTQAYIPKNIGVISTDEDTTGLSNKGYRTLSTYKGGALLKIGSEVSLLVEGTLLDENSKPLSLIGGKFVNLSSGKETTFFTGRNGKFFVEDLAEESYQIIIFDKKSVRVLGISLANKNVVKNKLNIGQIIMK
jgi:outer membrane usher protein FimD/PapC